MMDGARLQDRISYGMGVAARKLGLSYVVYRPRSPLAPLAPAGRVIKLSASFNAEDPDYRRVSAYDSPIWWGVFDAAYVEPGDYLVGDGATFFVAAQRRALPVQCVRTNRVIAVERTAVPTNLGYAGQVDALTEPILKGWPASATEQGDRAWPDAGASRLGSWTILLPPLPLAIVAGDLLRDDMGNRFAVGAAEQTDLGWRLAVRQLAA